MPIDQKNCCSATKFATTAINPRSLKNVKVSRFPLLICLGNCVLQMILSLSAKFFQNDFLVMCPNPVNR